MVVCVLVLLLSLAAVAQAPLPATDVTAGAIQAFINQLPRDAVSDRPIRVADVGGYKVGVYGVFRPRASRQEAIVHDTRVSEVYYMLEGAATLVTGGTLVDSGPAQAGITGMSTRAARIEGGISRRVTKGDVVIIPGRTPHWWSNLEGDISYMIVRPDPEGKQNLK
jgi:mannose-6-phosphate isomerase-like protein (cupin superfamily)